MKIASIFLACVFAVPALAQFYAPQTDFHDPSQRVFPVEAARVMAWKREPAVESVTFEVARAQKDETIWKIAWRDKAGAVLREATVRYSEADLLSGPEWYRSVWKQLRGAAAAKGKGTGAEVAKAFWTGAADAGVSRMEGVAAGMKVADAATKSAADAARLSGCLARTAAVMGPGPQVTLDSLLMARSAAWLCSAEELAGVALAEPWPAVLVLTGRHKQARALWDKLSPKPDTTTPPMWMWQTLLTVPPATQALVSAVQPENREQAGPVFEFYGSMETAYNAIWIEIVDKLWKAKVRERMHDYGTTLTWASKNRRPATDFAARAIKSWLEQLTKMPAQPGDADDVRDLAKKARAAVSGKSDVKAPTTELVELLKRGVGDSKEPLHPVAVATQRDLLGFGWEQGGLQLSSLYLHMSTSGGLQKDGKAIAEEWLTKVDGWEAFFGKVQGVEPAATVESGRYEFVQYGKIGAHLSASPPTAWPRTPDAHLRRRWLQDPNRGFVFSTEHEGDDESTTALIRRVISEGGPAQLGPLAMRWRYADIDEQINTLGLRETIAKAVPASLDSARMLIDAKFAADPNPLRYARELERVHWESGIAFAVEDVVLAYAEANAVADARRFFQQAEPGIANPMLRTRQIPQLIASFALLEGDDETARSVLEAYGKDDKVGWRLTYAVVRGDVALANEEIEKQKTNYPKAFGVATRARLKEWMGLYPALADRKHADHSKAIVTFPQSREMLLTQWLLLKRSKLPTDEAIEFLETSKAEDGDKLLIAALLKDGERFEKFLTEGITTAEEVRFAGGRALMVIPGRPYSSRGEIETNALMAWLRGQLRELPRQANPTDQRPAGADWLLPKLRAILEQKPAR